MDQSPCGISWPRCDEINERVSVNRANVEEV